MIKEPIDMKIFLSYCWEDYSNVKKVIQPLQEAGYSIWIDRQQIGFGDNIMNSIKQGLDEADVIIAFITDNYNKSASASTELGVVLLGTTKAKVLPVVIGEASVPSILEGITYRRYKEFDSYIARDILRQLEAFKAGSDENFAASEVNIKSENEEKYINQLKNALDNNSLTVVCGAGISVSAGIPSWNTLLLSMLNKCVNDAYKFEIADAQESLPSSNIILGKYLKLMLGQDFEKVLKECLYDSLGETDTYFGKRTYKETPLLQALIKLIRPRRNKGNVESVISFNFDSLIEDTLDKYGIDNQAIYDEGVVVSSTKIPIYHVHGYLPRLANIKTSNIVFSEDAYHTQFIDPYSWSNLIQLYKYMNNTCLLVGLSITDPNLRRLLDISKRKNNYDKPRHYIIKKKPNTAGSFKKTQIILEEQDANSLGLNVFWIDEFDEIPDILNRIST